MDYKRAFENIYPKAIELGKNAGTKIENIYHEVMRTINPIVCLMEGHKICTSPFSASYDMRSCRREGCDFHEIVKWSNECGEPPKIEIAGQIVTILPVAAHYLDY